MSGRRTALSVALLLAVLCLLVPAAPAAAEKPGSVTATAYFWPGPSTVPQVPPGWNGGLVVYAHGYTDPNRPLPAPGSPELLELLNPIGGTGGPRLSDLANSLGYAYAASTYTARGYAIEAGAADTLALVNAFKTRFPSTGHVYVVGASEGGLITVELLEKHPDSFSGGLSACGAVGGWDQLVRYDGDFRVLLDYYLAKSHLENPLGPDATIVPPAAVDGWEQGPSGPLATYFTNVFVGAPWTAEFLGIAGVPYNPTAPETKVQSALHVLNYVVLGTKDAQLTAGGNPYGNVGRIYRESRFFPGLNAGVQRVTPNPSAVAYVKNNYSPTGVLTRPLVSLHNLLDPDVPYRMELVYLDRVAKASAAAQKDYLGNLLTVPIVAPAYGHCNFTKDELALAFAALVYKVEGRVLSVVSQRQAAAPSWVLSFRNDYLSVQVQVQVPPAQR